MEKIKAFWQNRWGKNAVFLVILAVLFFTDAGQWVRVQMTGLTLRNPSNHVQENDKSKEVFSFPLQLMDESGNEVLLSELNDKPIFINFWASWCVPCLAEFGSLVELEQSVPEIRFLFVTSESQEDFYKYLERTEHELDFYKQMSRTPIQLEHGAIPASFLINTKGEILFQHFGAADWADEDVIAELKRLI
jgi:thiol-disulfide isomerase/thioredoxin